MPEMTQELVDQLVQQKLDLKIAVGEFRRHFFNTLTTAQREGLQALRVALGDDIDHLNAVAIQLSLEQLQGSLTHLGDITKGVNEAVVHLRETQKVLTVANALIDLGAAIASGDPAKVLAGIHDAVNSFRS
jgi:hypothetical protein